MVGRRHDSQEISDKLAQADQLAAKGKTQREISKALGVSVMTYHRWKKMLRSPAPETADEPDDGVNGGSPSRHRVGSEQLIKQLESWMSESAAGPKSAAARCIEEGAIWWGLLFEREVAKRTSIALTTTLPAASST